MNIWQKRLSVLIKERNTLNDRRTFSQLTFLFLLDQIRLTKNSLVNIHESFYNLDLQDQDIESIEKEQIFLLTTFSFLIN